MITLRQVPVWMDNYAYLLVHDDDALVVDAPEAGPVLEVASDLGVTIKCILNTHHHPDHVGANEELVNATGCDVVGPDHDRDRIPHLSIGAVVGESVDVIGLNFRVLDVRAHTMGHIAYALDAPIDVVIQQGHNREAAPSSTLSHRPALFVGDSLFAGGCGRLFEGSADDLAQSMRVLDAEDERALVVCAHEYTASNLKFAQSIRAGQGPDLAITARSAGLEATKAATGSSVPSTLELERETNPFLLALQDEPQAAYAASLDVDNNATEVIGALRRAKDNF